MPKLYHKKSRQGCLRCRQRRVKCDEAKPICSACTRHSVSCEYPQQAGSESPKGHTLASQIPSASSGVYSNGLSPLGQSSEVSSYGGFPSGSMQSVGSAVATTTPLELRLFQYWLIHTCSSFSIAYDYWRVRIPSIAAEHRPVLDGILAIAALHLYRQTDMGSPAGNAHRLKEAQIDNSLFMSGATSSDMLRHAVHYMHCAMRGHREAFENTNKDTVEAVYLSSVLITLISTFMLSADDNVDNTAAPFDESMWLRLGAGPRELIPVWKTFVDEGHPLTLTGALQGGPDLADNEELFKVEHAKPFDVLMTWALEFEHLNPEDYVAYQQTVSYIGLIHHMISREMEHPHMTARRFIAFPSRAPRRFVDLALSQQPRALVVLAHVFALMKILARHAPWMTGVGEKHVPRLDAKIPPGWRPVMQWPLAGLTWNENGGQEVPLPPSSEEIIKDSSIQV